jgi:Rieske Fe-S protein
MSTARHAGEAISSNPAGGVESTDAATATEQAAPEVRVSRRRWVRDAAIVGTAVVAGAGLAACSSAGPKPAAAGNGPTPGSVPGTANPAAPGTKAAAPAAKAAPPVPPAAVATSDQFTEFGLGKTSSVPVGGGVIYASHGVVVTQPTAGNFKCFSSSCTHLGCSVNKVEAGLIVCPCHGAKFSIVDGSVKAGPAPRPLTAQEFQVKNGEVVLD